MRIFQGKLVGVASQNDRVPWIIVRRDQVTGLTSVPISSRDSGAPSDAELTYAHTLLNRITLSRDEHPAAEETPPAVARQRDSARPAVIIQESNSVQSVRTERKKALPKERPVIQLKDAKDYTFVDFVCQVVKTWDDGYGRYTIYVTDYTTNELFPDNSKGSARDGDDFAYLERPKKAWTGPSGKQTLMVTLWEPHASYARQNLKASDFVLLTNVHIKLPKDRSTLEGVLHTDKRFPETLHIQLVDQTDDMPQFQELLRRKKEYWKKHGGQNDAGDEKPNSNRKKRKKEKAAEAQRKKQQLQVKKEEGQTALRIARPAGRPNQPNPHGQYACVPEDLQFHREY